MSSQINDCSFFLDICANCDVIAKDYAEKIWESRLFPLSLQVRNRKFNFADKSE